MNSVDTAEQIVGAFLAAGVDSFVYCPGSRNAPFAYALARSEAAGQAHVQVVTEERSAGFYALGRIKATGRPVAVVVTSGTAVAELLPAVEEARHQFLPLIAVSADRPFELQGVRASQTTEQATLLLADPTRRMDIPADGQPLSARVQRLVAVARGQVLQPGPVHLNVGLRDPLVPGSDWTVGTPVEVPKTLTVTGGPRSTPAWGEVVDPDLRTIVLAGDQADMQVLQEAGRRGIPILAEPSAGVLVGEAGRTWIPHASFIIEFLKRHVEQIIVTGHLTLNRSMTGLVDHPVRRKIVVAPYLPWQDAAGNADVVVPALAASGEPDSTGQAAPAGQPRSAGQSGLTGQLRSPRQAGQVAQSDSEWLELCRQTSRVAEQAIVEASTELNHLSAARAIWAAPESLWLGASNPVRAFEMAVNTPRPDPVFSNRGLAGIDGTIASALGVASGGRPVRAVMGDNTFVYDLPSLLAVTSAQLESETRQPETAKPETLDNLKISAGSFLEKTGAGIQLIVISDGGGTIFSTLEHGREQFAALHRRYFAAPTGVQVAAVAQACGWESRRVDNLADLQSELRKPIRGRSVLEVTMTSPGELFRRLYGQVAAKLEVF